MIVRGAPRPHRVEDAQPAEQLDIGQGRRLRRASIGRRRCRLADLLPRCGRSGRGGVGTHPRQHGRWVSDHQTGKAQVVGDNPFDITVGLTRQRSTLKRTHRRKPAGDHLIDIVPERHLRSTANGLVPANNAASDTVGTSTPRSGSVSGRIRIDVIRPAPECDSAIGADPVSRNWPPR